VPDAEIRYGTPDWYLVHRVFLDGDLQLRVETINFTQGFIRRPYQGEPTRPSQVKVPVSEGRHYIFDVEEDDFILETVHGQITVTWSDIEAGKAWLRKHSQ